MCVCMWHMPLHPARLSLGLAQTLQTEFIQITNRKCASAILLTVTRPTNQQLIIRQSANKFNNTLICILHFWIVSTSHRKQIESCSVLADANHNGKNKRHRLFGYVRLKIELKQKFNHEVKRDGARMDSIESIVLSVFYFGRRQDAFGVLLMRVVTFMYLFRIWHLNNK